VKAQAIDINDFSYYAFQGLDVMACPCDGIQDGSADFDGSLEGSSVEVANTDGILEGNSNGDIIIDDCCDGANDDSVDADASLEGLGVGVGSHIGWGVSLGGVSSGV
jgi:hypothetical protein